MQEQARDRKGMSRDQFWRPAARQQFLAARNLYAAEGFADYAKPFGDIPSLRSDLTAAFMTRTL